METGGQVQVGQVFFRLRDGGLREPKQKGKAPLLKRESLKNEDFEGRRPML